MKAKDILSSQTRAFSLFEVVVCLIILSLLLLIALPKSGSFAHRKCIFLLQERLQRSNQAFMELYSSKALRGETPTSSEIEEVLAILLERRSGENCYFQRSTKGVNAKIEGKTLSFTLSPLDFSHKPKIYCQLTNELCREFLGKTSQK